MKENILKRKNVLITGGIIAAFIIVILLIFSACSKNNTNSLNTAENNEMTVGTKIKSEDITEFYYTEATSTNPPYFLRYRFYIENGKHIFYTEKREGDHFPLTEADITVSASKEISDEKWQEVFDCLSGGKVEKRKDDITSGGSGPWTYIYWNGDKSKYQEFSFETVEKRAHFEYICAELAESIN